MAAPINVCGNAAAVLGLSEARCRGGAGVWAHEGAGWGGNRTSGAGGVLSGNQAVAPIAAPINVCGQRRGRPWATPPPAASAARTSAGPGTSVRRVSSGSPAPTQQGRGGQGAGCCPSRPPCRCWAAPQEVGGKVTEVAHQVQGLGSANRADQERPGRQHRRQAGGGLRQCGRGHQAGRGCGERHRAAPRRPDAARTLGLPALPELPGCP
ncbi:chaplin family protein [Nonomuraea rubra]|uniref:chaplin family protein n=1 Tax=Nonomuraea rubra TaxID=46180 RepID=UPI003CD05A9B